MPCINLRPTHSFTQRFTTKTSLVHLSNQLVDIGFPVTEITTLDIVLELAGPPASSWVRQFERPKEIRCLSEPHSQTRIRITEQKCLLV
jgi:hypothetical protein